MFKLLIVAGTRPNFVKIDSLLRAFHQIKPANTQILVVHTGQHYDYQMSQVFFEDLELPPADYFLNIGSGTHGEQTGKIMMAFETLCLDIKPDWVVVVGDVNSTLAAAIASKKLLIPVAHVEAGLRSFDMSMPEEINRKLTDAVSDLLFVTEQAGIDNLRKEGVADKQIFEVGNTMIDTLLKSLAKIATKKDADFRSAVYKQKYRSYALLTLHRPANVDDLANVLKIQAAINEVAATIPVIFPVHPRTAKNFQKFDVRFHPNVILEQPLGYLDFLYLCQNARFILTDSGGLQTETAFLHIPCLVLREVTEHVSTVTIGSNKLVGLDRDKIMAAVAKIMQGEWPQGRVPPLWDGLAGQRIMKIICQKLGI